MRFKACEQPSNDDADGSTIRRLDPGAERPKLQNPSQSRRSFHTCSAGQRAAHSAVT